MAVHLERHQLVGMHGAELGDTADVVAGEVDQHHVLGAFFGMLDQLGREAAIVLVGGAALASAGDRAADHLAVEQLHHRFRRRPDDRDLGMPQEVHVGAGVDLTQHAIHVERVGLEFDVVALSQHDLEDVALQDVLLGDLDSALVHPVRHRRLQRRQLVVFGRGLDRHIRQGL